MKRVLVRADDLGYSEGVNYGIIKSIKDGIVNNVGVMVNMDATKHGVDLIKEYPVCLGQHTNICIGKPICEPSLIPSIVDEFGQFKASKIYRSAKNDFVVLDEVILEIEAQYEKFKELFGREPDYFEGHAVASDNFFKGLQIVAKRHGLKYSGMPLHGEAMLVGKTYVYMNMDSSQPDYNPFISLKKIAMIERDEVEVMVLHPGYLDDFILKNSSLTIPRTLEVSMACNDMTRQWLSDNDIKLMKYSEL